MSGPSSGAGDAWAGGAFGATGQCVLAPNPGPMTLDGTNTWVLRAPGADRSVVIDPGPLDDAHLDAIGDVVRQVDMVLVTHHHLDHTEAARAFAERVGCGVRGSDPAQCWRADPLVDEEVIDVAGLRLEVMATPGHTADSLSFVVPQDGALLTGDAVLGRGTTVVAHPDGQLGAYLDSLARMREAVRRGEVSQLWPAHGPVLPEAAAVLDHYAAHRQQRLDQVRDVVGSRSLRRIADADLEALVGEVLESVYADVDRAVWPAAALSIRAQLEYLRSA